MKKLLVFFLFINSLFAYEYDSAYMSAIEHESNEDYEKAKLAFEQSISNCPKCNADSYFHLSQHYRGTPYGKEKNLQKAFELNLKGAKLGSESAQFGVADDYNLGTGTTKNQQKAVYWYKKAIEQNHTSSMYNIGLIYYWGKGNVAMDKKLTYKYWMKCAESKESEKNNPQAKKSCQKGLDILCKESPWACK